MATSRSAMFKVLDVPPCLKYLTAFERSTYSISAVKKNHHHMINTWDPYSTLEYWNRTQPQWSHRTDSHSHYRLNSDHYDLNVVFGTRGVGERPTITQLKLRHRVSLQSPRPCTGHLEHHTTTLFTSLAHLSSLQHWLIKLVLKECSFRMIT
jgi:hypothetical protein